MSYHNSRNLASYLNNLLVTERRRVRALIVAALLALLTPGVTGCAAQLQCASDEGRRLVEAASAHLSYLWDRDQTEWRRRAEEVARLHGRSLLYCIADTLDTGPARSLVAGQAQRLRELAAQI